ncbi:MAG TPA: ATP-binding cassette domain-containing protein [Bacteroidota bacterium]|nr:ATP-binding cassette domain-containing protein [Bacteroidota bacterium]
MSIAVRDLTKLYGDQKAIDGISFDVRTGEILGFLGPNGAGKTTTMKIITCYMPPNAGTVEVDGLNIEEHSLEVRRKIGYLPENNPLYHDMNVLEYLEYAAQLHGMNAKQIQHRIKEMVHVCGLESVRHKDIGELSKGYRQRVGLAQAMIHDPDVLILDEPTSGLDPNQIVEIRNLIKQLGRAKTVILSTHILPEVQATCDRVLIINEGKIVADGTPEQLQQEFRGAESLTLELRTNSADPLNQVSPKLRSLPGVGSVELLGQKNGTSRFMLHVDKGADVRESAFRLAVAEGWVILEMHRKATTLEEVFHKLTAG